MISIASLFNFAIYKNTLRRFKWGSFLYLVALFFTVPFMLLVQDIERLTRQFEHIQNYVPLILESGYMVFPMLLAVAVPVIVATLIFNNVHSAKQGIFVHGLPVTRLENYVSSILAGFTLMAVPVLINAGVLLIMSLTAYDSILSASSVVYWMGINLAMLFVMFSIATLASFLTGNTAAHIGITAFLNIVPVLIALIIILISDVFLFGFVETEGFIANEIVENTPIVWLFSKATGHRSAIYRNMFTYPQMWYFIVGAVIVYILSFLLYRKRKIETCGDVAAFSKFKPILKYSVTVAAATAAFGSTVYTQIGAVGIFAVAITVSAIVYFAAEMLMNKTFKVFRRYKGYAAFLTASALFISFFAFTHVFGYETNVPDFEDIEAATISDHFARHYVSDPELIENVRTIHNEYISDIPITTHLKDYMNGSYYNNIYYKLKDGKTIERKYMVNDDEFINAMSKMYENTEYKMLVTGLNQVNTENVTSVRVSARTSMEGQNIIINNDVPELLAAIKEDISNLSFMEMERGGYGMNFDISFDITYRENKIQKIFDDSVYGQDPIDEHIHNFTLSFNSNYKKTMEFMKKNGYYQYFVNGASDNLYICKIPVYISGQNCTYKGDTGNFYEFRISTADCVKLSHKDSIALVESLVNDSGISGRKDGKNYIVFLIRDDQTIRWMQDGSTFFQADSLPETLKKYVDI